MQRRSNPSCASFSWHRLLAAVLVLAFAAPAFANHTLTHRIQQLLQSNTDGTVGLYRKQVDGPVDANSNETFPTYAASTIKVLHHLHTMRQVDLVNLDLETQIPVCNSCRQCPAAAPCDGDCPVPGPQPPCAFVTNCNDTPGNAAVCPNTMPIRCALQRMMRPSDNQAPNALQDFFGAGDASVGRDAMNQTAWVDVGMSMATAMQHKFACGNVSNNPFNTLTLEDLGLLYEQVATDPNLLQPATRTLFYQYMLNENAGTMIGAIQGVANQEATNLGMNPGDQDVVDFNNEILLANKSGNIGVQYVSSGAWIEVPHECGEEDREYVFGFFVDNAQTNTNAIDTVMSELVRDALNDGLASVQCQRAPVVAAPAPLEAECTALGGTPSNDPQITSWLDEATAEDACDGPMNVSSSVLPALLEVDCGPGTGDLVPVTFESPVDTCGAQGSDQANIHVIDTIDPIIQNVPADMQVECDAVPAPPTLDATDVCAGDLGTTFDEETTPLDCPGNYDLTWTWTATDDCGNETEASTLVEVRDTTPPVIQEVTEDLHCLWPPNHKYACFGMEAFQPALSDNCSEPVTWQFTGCASDQPDDAAGTGDGHTVEDCIVAQAGDEICVRAERAGTIQAGRRYTVTATATDACGNTSEATAIGAIHVPHDKAPGQSACL